MTPDPISSPSGPKPRRWWLYSVLLALAAIVSGNLFMMLNEKAVLPLSLRDAPWPLEVMLCAFALAAAALAVRAFRVRRTRVVAAVCAFLTLSIASLFVWWAHDYTFRLPPAPPELAVGKQAPDFTLPDSAGGQVTLSSLKGHPVLLVFYRGFW